MHWRLGAWVRTLFLCEIIFNSHWERITRDWWERKTSLVRPPLPFSNGTSWCLNSPPKIKSIRIVDNPFDDIVPRITAAEKRAQQRAREQAQREREEEMRRRGAKKCVYWHTRNTLLSTDLHIRNTKLLSFQDEGMDEEEPETFKKKSISRPDCELLTFSG